MQTLDPRYGFFVKSADHPETFVKYDVEKSRYVLLPGTTGAAIFTRERAMQMVNCNPAHRLTYISVNEQLKLTPLQP